MRKRLIVLFLIISSYSFGQQYDFVKIMPGKGVVYNNDSILLNKTTIIELHRILKIKDNSNPNEFSMTMWDGFDSETFESTYGVEYTREIKYKSIGQAGVSCFVGQKSAIFEIQFFVGSLVIKIPACV